MSDATKPLVVVTGASSGIGAAVAQRLSEAGHPLLLLARRGERLKALDLPNAMTAELDIRDTDGLKAAIAKAEAEYGPVDCLVNNAGVMLLGQIDSQDPAEWQRMFDVNVVALLGAMQVVLEPMKARKTGTIINISSIAGRKSFPNHAAYCGTKFAVSAISETVREEVAGDDVRVISICPGTVETELLGHTTSQQIKDDYQAWKASMGAALEADDVARAVSFVYEQPQNVNIREVVLAPTRQPQ